MIFSPRAKKTNVISAPVAVRENNEIIFEAPENIANEIADILTQEADGDPSHVDMIRLGRGGYSLSFSSLFSPESVYNFVKNFTGQTYTQRRR